MAQRPIILRAMHVLAYHELRFARSTRMYPFFASSASAAASWTRSFDVSFTIMPNWRWEKSVAWRTANSPPSTSRIQMLILRMCGGRTMWRGAQVRFCTTYRPPLLCGICSSLIASYHFALKGLGMNSQMPEMVTPLAQSTQCTLRGLSHKAALKFFTVGLSGRLCKRFLKCLGEASMCRAVHPRWRSKPNVWLCDRPSCAPDSKIIPSLRPAIAAYDWNRYTSSLSSAWLCETKACSSFAVGLTAPSKSQTQSRDRAAGVIAATGGAWGAGGARVVVVAQVAVGA
mmetsp:Transcript_89117/g.252521  ORF Transcript_89117/g.252521 Transcript_89117/m.252521 type:complete len:286 (-) Transcript_89117:323-1180(-)